MWFVVGFVLVAALAYGVSAWRLSHRWRGKPAKWQDIGYDYAVTRNKGRVVRLRIGVGCATGLHFELRRENGFDRWFKSIGLSAEMQVDGGAFDHHVYVVSDDSRLRRALRHDGELHALIGRLFDGRALAAFRIVRLHGRNRRLWIEAKPVASTRDCDHEAVAAEVLPVLRPLSVALATAASAASGSQDRYLLRASVLTGIAWALAINGAVQALHVMFAHFPVVVDGAALWRASLVVAALLLVALLALTVALLGRSARAHLVFVEMLLVGGIGAVASSYTGLRDYDIEFDRQPAQAVATTIDRHYTTRCGKRNRSTCYHLGLAGAGALGQSLTMQVDYGTWQSLPQDSAVTVPLHAGTLGFRWIEAPQRLIEQ